MTPWLDYCPTLEIEYPRYRPAMGNHQKICARCGGSAEYKIKIHNDREDDYEIFECVDCGFLEWLPRIQSSELKRD